MRPHHTEVPVTRRDPADPGLASLTTLELDAILRAMGGSTPLPYNHLYQPHRDVVRKVRAERAKRGP